MENEYKAVLNFVIQQVGRYFFISLSQSTDSGLFFIFI